MLKKTTLIAVVALSLAACNAIASISTPVPPTKTSVNPSPAAGLCTNPLAPVKLGATWTYRITDSAADTATVITTITDVHPDGFTVAAKFGEGASVNQEWACKPEGLAGLALGADQTALGLSGTGITAQLTASNPTGVTLPSKVGPGAEWPYGLDLAGSLTQGSLAAKVNGNVSTSFKAVGTESVTVPAGTFDATRVEGTSTFKVSANFGLLSLPMTSVVNTTFWFAPGVGWIKAVETGELAGTAVNTITELQSYHIP